MIRDLLISALKRRFPELPFSFDESPEVFASLQSPCQALGRIDICDDGDEATVFFQFTHGHFSCFDESLPVEQREQQITDNVIRFLESVFSDRVVVFQLLGGLAGGWRVLKPDEDIPLPSVAKRQFLWTREIR